MKVCYINRLGTVNTVSMDKNAQLYPHFKLWELANNKGDSKQPQMEISPEVDDFFSMIEEFRGWWNKPMTCNSCFRQPDYNASVGGAPNSLHLHALAFDWGVSLSYNQRVSVCWEWAAICKRRGKIGGINFYSWGVHLDANEDYYGYKSFVIRNGNTIVNTVPRP